MNNRISGRVATRIASTGFTRATAAALATAALLIAVPDSNAASSSSGPAPQFTLDSRAGSKISLGQYKGQVVMLNFWASWCGPCRQEMPLLESIYKKYNKMGFTLIGVNVEPDSKAAEGFLKQTPVSFPVIYDKDSTVSKAYDVSGMPSTVIIDRKGNIRVLHRGYKPGDENEYLDSIRSLVRE
jgi:thiol-disulfide isomerase/thioredoxin